MTPTDFMIDDTILKLIEKYQENIEIQFIQHSSENTASILVVDKKLSLSVEIKDETQQISNDLAIGLATYSNCKSTVLSYASMFESFWREAEIYEKLKESRIQLNDAKTEIDNMKEYLNEVLEELHGKQQKDAQIGASGDRVFVTWWERNATSNEPVLKISTDNGKTFGPILKLAANGTIGSSGGG